MFDLELDYDEGILLESDCASLIVKGYTHLSSLVLTNKRLYYVYQKSTGFFSKPITEVVTRTLSEIKIINGKPLVEKIRDDSEIYLQIQFVGGRERFHFDERTNRTTDLWVNELHKLLTGNEAPVKRSEVVSEAKATLSEAKGAFSGFASGLKKAAGSAIQNATDSAKQYVESDTATKHKESIIGAVGAISGFAASVKSAADDVVRDAVDQYHDYQEEKKAADIEFRQMLAGSPAVSGNSPERQQEFAGVVLKCPNCGAPISQTTAVCPVCGYQITGQAAVSSVQRFSNQLMLLESRRKRDGLGHMFGTSVNPTDKQKLSLIQSFAIPNTIDDIQEFILLAIANIDVNLSKSSIGNRYQNKIKVAETGLTIARTISDAWVSKMQQAYHKAKISFPDHPAFESIKNLYVSKMRELKLPIE